MERDIAFAGLFSLGNLPVTRGGLRTEFFERIEGKDDVLGRNRIAIMPLRIGAKSICYRGKIVRVGDGFGEHPVRARNFVECRHHQSVIEKFNAAN